MNLIASFLTITIIGAGVCLSGGQALADSQSCEIQSKKTYATSSRQLNLPGLVGELYTPIGCRPKYVVIALGGSEGGIPSGMAKAFAAMGGLTLAVGYFGIEGLPANLDQIPLEYFQNAVSQTQTLAGSPKYVFLVGFSKGAEGALAFASIFRTPLSGIVLISPADRAFGGLGQNNAQTGHSARTFEFEKIPYTPYVNPDHSLLQQMFPQGFTTPPVLKPFYEATMALSTGDQGVYAIEKIAAPVIIFSGQDDQLWPSARMAENIIARAKTKSFPYSIENYSYPNAGHLLVGGADYLSQDPYGHKWLGGTIDGSRVAEVDILSKMGAFFAKIVR